MVDSNICRKAIEHFGDDYMLNVCTEEPSELIQAISKLRREGENQPRICSLCEEIADNYIILEELKQLYELDPGEIDEWIRIKQERTMQRIGV